MPSLRRKAPEYGSWDVFRMYSIECVQQQEIFCGSVRLVQSVCFRKGGNMSKGYCIYYGNVLNARKLNNRIKIISNHEVSGLEKNVDEYGHVIWQRYLLVDECEDYYEVSTKVIINNKKVKISLSVSGNWIIETFDEIVARELDMMEIDRNIWSKALTVDKLLEANYEIEYEHLDSSLNKSVIVGIWDFLAAIDKLFSEYKEKHLAYKRIILSILQSKYEQSEKGADRIYSKIVQFDDLFYELVYLCRYGELKSNDYVEVEGYWEEFLELYIMHINA